eukprot:TRINITY_DN56300_c0_g1_i1.p1 TRINITY_DN56300_c0_g1~~TRINITY_DN56300_c0_g1_i1.p1  ORF type:complete len:776 (-),score=24.21 TRINITY_DN56300_c0_g1_i1:321-2648(-)
MILHGIATIVWCYWLASTAWDVNGSKWFSAMSIAMHTVCGLYCSENFSLFSYLMLTLVVSIPTLAVFSNRLSPTYQQLLKPLPVGWPTVLMAMWIPMYISFYTIFHVALCALFTLVIFLGACYHQQMSQPVPVEHLFNNSAKTAWLSLAVSAIPLLLHLFGPWWMQMLLPTVLTVLFFGGRNAYERKKSGQPAMGGWIGKLFMGVYDLTEAALEAIEKLLQKPAHPSWVEMLCLPMVMQFSSVSRLPGFLNSLNMAEQDDVIWSCVFGTFLWASVRLPIEMIYSCPFGITFFFTHTTPVAWAFSSYYLWTGRVGTGPLTFNDLLLGHKVGAVGFLMIEALFCGTALNVPLGWTLLRPVTYLKWTLLDFALLCLLVPGLMVFNPLCLRLAYIRLTHVWKGDTGTLVMHVRRDRVLDDTLRRLAEATPNQQYAPWKAEFNGELGADLAGLTKGWLRLLAKELSLETQQLFAHNKGGRLYIHPMSVYLNPNRGTMGYLIQTHGGVDPIYRLIGMVLGKCMVYGTPCGLDLCSAILKFILNPDGPLGVGDLEDFDPELAGHLQQVPLEHIDHLHLTFSADVRPEWAAADIDTQEVPLCSGGCEMAVTKDNFDVYVNLLADFYLRQKCHSQLQALREGVLTVVNESLLKLLTFEEVRGMWTKGAKLNVQDWKAETVYSGRKPNDNELIENFWQFIGSLALQKQQHFFQWVTELDSTPPGGCRSLSPPFTINIIARQDPPQLPQAHTCFNTLDLPRYESAKELENLLHTTIENAGEVYGVM